MTPEELQRLREQQASTPPPATTPRSTPPATTPQSTAPRPTTPTSTAPGTTTPSSTVPTPTLPTSAPPPATLPTSTPPATTQTGGVAPSTLFPSVTQPTTSTAQGLIPPIVPPTTSTTGVVPIVQPTTSSTGVTPIVQPATSTTGITPYVTPGIAPAPTPARPTTPQSTPPPTTAPGVAPAPPPSPTGTSGTAGLGHGGGTASLPAGPDSTQTETGHQATPPPRTTPSEDESPEAVLARMRAERDADNAISLRDSDANRTGWLAQVGQILQGLRTPTEQAQAYGAALFERMADYCRELLGHEPWAWTAMGKVLRVDTATKTCRVQMAADALNPAAVPGQRKVSYGAATPKVGQTVPVHFPTRVTRSGPLEAEPDPEHLPWLKVPGGARWLYWQDLTTHILWRYAWPPPSESAGWRVEQVRVGIPDGWHLFGSATPADTSTQIVFTNQDLSTRTFQDTNFDHFIQFVQRYHHYSEMGFGALATEWTPTPPYVIARAIANDGTTTGGNAEFGDTITYAGGYDIWPVIEEDFPGPPPVCHVSLDPSFSPPTIAQETELGGRAWRGTLGAFDAVQSVTDAWTVDYYSGSVTIIDNCGVVHPNFAPWVTQRWHYIGTVADGLDGLLCWGAWDYDDRPAAGYAWYAGTWAQTGVAGPTAAIPGEVLYGEIDRRMMVYGSGCTPAGPTPLPVYGDPIAIGRPDLLTASLDLDRNLQLWASVFNPDQLLLRWRADSPSAWEVMLRLTRLQAVSRDGTDLLGFDAGGAQIYSLDSGATWQPCPPLPNGAGPVPPGDWRNGAPLESVPLFSSIIFVDEVA